MRVKKWAMFEIRGCPLYFSQPKFNCLQRDNIDNNTCCVASKCNSTLSALASTFLVITNAARKPLAFRCNSHCVDTQYTTLLTLEVFQILDCRLVDEDDKPVSELKCMQSCSLRT